MDGIGGRTTGAVLAAGLALLVPAAAAGQADGSQVLREAMERYEGRLEDVESVSVVQEVTTPMGTTTTQEQRLVKTTRNGRSILLPEGGDAAEEMPVTSLYANLDSVANRAVLRGRAEADGSDVYVVGIPDLSGLDVGGGGLPSGRAEALSADSAILHVDSERYVVRRAEMFGTVSMAGRNRPIHVRADMSDFRERQGYLHPFRTEIRFEMEGMAEQMRAMMQKMQGAGADSAQRKMMEQAMSALMGGEMLVTARVTELEVDGG